MENKDVFQKNSSFIISRIFNDQFGKEVPIKVIKKIKLDILWLFDFEKTKKEYLEKVIYPLNGYIKQLNGTFIHCLFKRIPLVLIFDGLCQTC